MRLLGLSEDRQHLLLTGPETGTVMLPVDDRVRAAVLGDSGRLATLEANPDIRLESALSPREIQARFRAGESAEQVALAAGVSVDRVRWLEGPVRDERVHAVDEARAAYERGAEPVPLGERVDDRLAREGADPASVEWDSWRRDDGVWAIQLRYRAAGRAVLAQWLWDATRRTLSAADEIAEDLSGPTTERHFADALAVTAEEPQVGLTLVRHPAVAELPVPEGSGAEPADIPAAAERRTGRTDKQAESDGVAPGKRATVPTWDEILLGTRPPDH
ncbi:MAG: septation protein SepH [Actinomycetes bacterium]